MMSYDDMQYHVAISCRTMICNMMSHHDMQYHVFPIGGGVGGPCHAAIHIYVSYVQHLCHMCYICNDYVYNDDMQGKTSLLEGEKGVVTLLSRCYTCVCYICTTYIPYVLYTYNI